MADARSASSRAPGPALDGWLRAPFRPPLDWAALVGFLARRAVPGVEEVDPGAGTYRRAALLAGAPACVEVRIAADGRALELRVDPPRPGGREEALARVRGMFDLDRDPAEVAAALGRDPLLARALRAHPGLRVPGGWDGFEVLVRAVLGQQVSVAAAAQLAARIAAGLGDPVRLERAPGLRHLFPRPEQLAVREPAAFPVPRSRGATLVALGGAVSSGRFTLERGASLEDTLARLRAPGVGPWTAQLVAMRALREPDAFPAGDLALRRALGRGGAPATEEEARLRAEAWRPWRAYAAQHLWVLDAERSR
jgi:AraC family transcriptional regulator of adaptative response / DNA-3-methyladenine glycosylase II